MVRLMPLRFHVHLPGPFAVTSEGRRRCPRPNTWGVHVAVWGVGLLWVLYAGAHGDWTWAVVTPLACLLMLVRYPPGTKD